MQDTGEGGRKEIERDTYIPKERDGKGRNEGGCFGVFAHLFLGRQDIACVARASFRR